MIRILLPILLVYNISFGQILAEEDQLANRTEKHCCILKASIISFIDQLSFPTVQIGLERKLTSSYSFSGELGLQLYKFPRFGVDTGFVRTRGVKANFEIRKYRVFRQDRASHPLENDMTGFYMGLNVFFRANRFNNNVYYSKHNDTSVRNDCFWAVKTIWGANAVVGVQRKISGFLTIDLFSGLGIMHRVARNYNREFRYGVDRLITPIDLNARTIFNEASLSDKNGWYPNLNLGIRLGLRI
jgi:hypothetical protein